MKAKERIEFSESQARYKKVGGKYVQCNDFDAYNGLEDGWWLVKVAPYCKSIRACVYPAKAELMAAIKDKEDQLVQVIRKVSEARPKEGIKMTEQAALDWRHFIDKHGAEFNTLYYPSIQENAELIVKALLNDKYV